MMDRFTMRVIFAAVSLSLAAGAVTRFGSGTCNYLTWPEITRCSILSVPQGKGEIKVTFVPQYSSPVCSQRGGYFGWNLAGKPYLWVRRGCSAYFTLDLVTQDVTATTSPPTTFTQLPGCGESNSASFRVLGGTSSKNCEFPWMVMVYELTYQTVCGGSILDERHIITAAHCLLRNIGGRNVLAQASNMVILSGSSRMPFTTANIQGLDRDGVARVKVHEGFNPRTLQNDIAIVTLKKPLVFDTCHRPVCLANGAKTPQQAQNCMVMGWGVTSNRSGSIVTQYLQSASLPILPDYQCQSIYGSLASRKTFCAGGRGTDSCEGDSGGPLVCRENDGRYYQYGVVSAGVSGPCGIAAGIYTRLSTFLAWIQKQVG